MKAEQPLITWKHSGKAGAPHVLGLNPWVYDFAAYNVWSRPAGLLCCLDMLSRAGADTALADFMDRGADKAHWPAPQPTGKGPYPKVSIPRPLALKEVPRRYCRYGLNMDQARQMLKSLSPQPDVVLVTSLMTYWYPGVFSAIRLVRETFPHSLICLGGIYATLCPEHAVQAGADLVFSGPLEREGNWSRLWSAMGHDVPPIPHDAGMFSDTSYYRNPDFSIIMTSRGCPFSCQYCASSVIYPGFRHSSPDFLCAHIQKEYDQGVRDFSFYDDAMLVSPEKVLYHVLKYIVSNDLQLRLHAPNAMHIRYLTAKTCRLLKQAGLYTIRLGLETLDFMNRSDSKLRLEEFNQGVASLLKAGFVKKDIVVYILAGLPGQKNEDLSRTIRQCVKMGLRPELNYYSPIPGTPMFYQAEKYSEYPLDEPLLHNNSVWPCVKGGFSWETHKHFKKMTKTEPDKNQHTEVK